MDGLDATGEHSQRPSVTHPRPLPLPLPHAAPTAKRPRPETPLSEQDPVPSRPRRRNAIACSVCRARKTKCDNKRPRCSYCQSIGASCDESIAGEKLSAPLVPLPDTQTILDRLDRLEWTLLCASRDTNAYPPAAHFESSSTSIPARSVATRAQVRNLNNKSNSTPDATPEFYTVESVLRWPIFGDRYASCLSLRDLMTRSLSGNLDCISPVSSGRIQPHLSMELESCSNLLQNFFNRIHIKNPILDETEVRKWAKEVSFNGIGWDARSCLVLLICALGSVSEDFPSQDPTNPARAAIDSEDRHLADAWFSASQKRIGTLLSHGGGILEAQCFFFSAVYLMHTFRPFSAWPLFLQAFACCQSFHCFAASSATNTAFPVHDFAEDGLGWRSEESVYWTCFKSELENRIELALPGFNAVNLNYPEFLPSPPPESLHTQNQAWYFYLAEIALRRLANQILGEFLPYSSADSFCDLTGTAMRLPDFERQAEEWSKLLPPEVDIHSGQDEDILRFILKGHLQNCYESMYWPFVVKAINFPERRDRSLDHLVSKALQVCVDRIWVNVPGFKHRHHGTWGMMRSCTRSALVLLAAKKCGQLDLMLCDGWQDAVEQVINLLEFWQGECGDAENRRNILQSELISL